MKKTILLTLVWLGFIVSNVSCVSSAHLPAKTLNKLIFKNIQQCQAAGLWNVPVMGLSVTLITYERCVGVKNLVLLSINTQNNVELENATIAVVMLRYVHYLNTTDAGNKLQWSAQLIKKTQLAAMESPTRRKNRIYYYVLKGKAGENVKD